LRKLIAVDSGKTGSYSLVNNEEIQRIEIHNLDEIGEFIDHMKEIQDQVESNHAITAVVEQPPPFTGNFSVPSSRGFKLGESYGQVCGVLRALGFPLVLVKPREWQRSLPGLKGLSGHHRKRVLTDCARRLMPSAKITVRNADSALIAYQFLSTRNNTQSKATL